MTDQNRERKVGREGRSRVAACWCAWGMSALITSCSEPELVAPGRTIEEPTANLAEQQPDEAEPARTTHEAAATQGLPLDSAAARAEQLEAILPAARQHFHGGQLRRLHGALGRGATPRDAAEAFREKAATALGLAPRDLVPERANDATPRRGAAEGVGLMYDPASGKHKFRLYTYSQERGGFPVHGGSLRVLVRDAGEHSVVWANTDLRSVGEFRAPATPPTDRVDLKKSLRALRKSSVVQRQRLPAPTELTLLGRPTPTIFAGAGEAGDPADTAPWISPGFVDGLFKPPT